MQITRHGVKGFDPRFTDLPDYILKCTAQIWEGHDIAALDWHYIDGCRTQPTGRY